MELTEVSGNHENETGAPWVPADGEPLVDDPVPRPVEASRPTAVCVHTGPVCVTIIDWTPSLPPAGGVCRCGACHADYQAESAAWFY